MVAEVLENRKDVVHVSGGEQRRLQRSGSGSSGLYSRHNPCVMVYIASPPLHVLTVVI